MFSQAAWGNKSAEGGLQRLPKGLQWPAAEGAFVCGQKDAALFEDFTRFADFGD